MKEIFDKLNSIAKGVRLIKARSNTLDSVKKIFNCRISKDLEEWDCEEGGLVLKWNTFKELIA